MCLLGLQLFSYCLHVLLPAQSYIRYSNMTGSWKVTNYFDLAIIEWQAVMLFSLFMKFLMGYHFHLFCNLQHLPEHESSTTCTALASDYDTGRVDILKSVKYFSCFLPYFVSGLASRFWDYSCSDRHHFTIILYYFM